MLAQKMNFFSSSIKESSHLHVKILPCINVVIKNHYYQTLSGHSLWNIIYGIFSYSNYFNFLSVQKKKSSTLRI